MTISDRVTAPPARREGRRPWVAVGIAVRKAAQKARQRRALRDMADWQLRDIGISRADADREARRRWWDGGTW